MACLQPVYRPRDAEHPVLHQVIGEHLEALLREAAAAGEGVGLAQLVEREFREFLTCGAFEHGSARCRGEGCAHEPLVPLSCKGRGSCPGCGRRRMTERAAHLVDEGLLHTLALDGVFSEAHSGALEFHPAPGSRDAEVAEALATVRHRVRRLSVRRGLEPGDEATGPVDRLAEESPVLAGIASASVQGRVALGPSAGPRVRRPGRAPDIEAVTSREPRQAHLEGFDLHANVWVSAHDRAGLERLCRYVLRPPFAQERLRLRDDGRVVVELRPRPARVQRRALSPLARGGRQPSCRAPGPMAGRSVRCWSRLAPGPSAH